MRNRRCTRFLAHDHRHRPRRHLDRRSGRPLQPPRRRTPPVSSKPWASPRCGSPRPSAGTPSSVAPTCSRPRSKLKLATGIANIYARDPMTTACVPEDPGRGVPGSVPARARREPQAPGLQRAQARLQQAAQLHEGLSGRHGRGHVHGRRPRRGPGPGHRRARAQDARGRRHPGWRSPPLLHQSRAHRVLAPDDGRRPAAGARADGGAQH